MNNELKAVQQLATIQKELVSLFEDFCNRAPSNDLAALLQGFKESRLNLVFTVNTSIAGTDFFCGAMPVDGAPADLLGLFTVYSPAAGGPSGRPN